MVEHCIGLPTFSEDNLISDRSQVLCVAGGPGQGGQYLEMFKEEIEARGGMENIDVRDLIEIRDKIGGLFGGWNP